ncbi:MAG: hypothetical protein D6703_01240 [Zetaproteobacteria bacterium]|nr:MAG: hypothetical protein D6703_01240 [Zetaproteobacteria bacterium]
MVGLTLANALRGLGWRVVIIERGGAPVVRSLGLDCRVSAIVAGNVQMLRATGAWTWMEGRAQALVQMRVWDDQHAGGIRFDAAEIGQPFLGYLVENSNLQQGLLQNLEQDEDIELCLPANITDIQWYEEAVNVVIDGQRRFSAPLIVGADGGRSWLREQSGIDCWQRDYRQKGIVATVRPRRHHHGIAFQRFMRTGPLAVLPMCDGLCSIVWSNDNEQADALMAMDDEAFLGALNDAFGPVLGDIVETGRRAAFPLRAQLARHLVRPRLALIGDAAHTIHPLAGLGVNLGMRDAMVLAQEIVDARRFDEDWGSMDVLKRYMKQRLPDILSVMGGMEGFHQLFTSSLPGLHVLRGMGMRLVGNAGLIKQLLMRNATGLSLPVPRRIG